LNPFFDKFFNERPVGEVIVQSEIRERFEVFLLGLFLESLFSVKVRPFYQ